MSERGMQVKSDNLVRALENGDAPSVCESCLGENPYIRMQKIFGAGTCKICNRGFTIFKWRPGRGEGYRKTEVCQSCSKTKNVCQTCILDLQFGLPSVLRDTILAAAEDDSLVPPESDANREYQIQQHITMLSNGLSAADSANEKLINIARATATSREQRKAKLANIAAPKRSHEEAFAEETCISEDYHESATAILPPGITDIEMLNEFKKHNAPSFFSPNNDIPALEIPSESGRKEINKKIHISDTKNQNVREKKESAKKVVKHVPRPPSSAPPSWAFK